MAALERTLVRRLTDAEIEKEVQDIRTKQWPSNVLPVKSLYVPFQTGHIQRTADAILPIVTETPHLKYTYDSLEEMVRAGWVPD